jgi:hypothetical protein
MALQRLVYAGWRQSFALVVLLAHVAAGNRTLSAARTQCYVMRQRSYSACSPLDVACLCCGVLSL